MSTKKTISFVLCVCLFSFVLTCERTKQQSVVDSTKIDRQNLVQRHNPSVTSPDSLSPFSVGNGEFAFTADFTGLQSFPNEYENGIPLCTQSQWGWHSEPNPNHYSLDQTLVEHEINGKKVGYAANQKTPAGQWSRANPHRLNLGQVGLRMKTGSGQDIDLDDITDIRQTLDLWTGILHSHFQVQRESVEVQTACHPEHDQIGVKLNSDLMRTGDLGIVLQFPYGSTKWGKNASDWNRYYKHRSEILGQTDQAVLIKRTMDETTYFVLVRWQGRAQFERTGLHQFVLNGKDSTFEFSVLFTEKEPELTGGDSNTFQASIDHWETFWNTGAAIDLSESKDKRAHELERRIILSRYLTAIQCSGSLPPQETGLTCNSWYGKFHLEMHWWHALHFALWNQPELFEKSLAWYQSVGLPMAIQKAHRQQYQGARWPKMVGFDGRESPSEIGVYLIWQQVHPIYYAELLYQLNPTQETLEKYQTLVFETARFMASYARWDQVTQRYVLGPPLIPAQEIYQPDSTLNPTFELAYWQFGLKTAQLWRERLGMDRSGQWDHVIQFLSPLPSNNELYQNAENALNTFDDPEQRKDHPTLLAAFGMLPDRDVNKDTMRSTLTRVMKSWNWEHTWGWDYPMISMTAARVGTPELAIDALMMDAGKNTYLNNGHNFQTSDLPVYLPGNGGLLTAIAMMAGGWKGAPDMPAPGFPRNGQWKIRIEGFHPIL